MISFTTPLSGAGKGTAGWFPITQASIGYDHTVHHPDEHALLLDFTNYDIGTDARVALELDLDAGRALLEQLTVAIAAAERSGV